MWAVGRGRVLIYQLSIIGRLFYFHKCIFWDVPEKQQVGSSAGSTSTSTEAQPIGRIILAAGSKLQASFCLLLSGIRLRKAPLIPKHLPPHRPVRLMTEAQREGVLCLPSWNQNRH